MSENNFQNLSVFNNVHLKVFVRERFQFFSHVDWKEQFIAAAAISHYFRVFAVVGICGSYCFEF